MASRPTSWNALAAASPRETTAFSNVLTALGPPSEIVACSAAWALRPLLSCESDTFIPLDVDTFVCCIPHPTKPPPPPHLDCLGLDGLCRPVLVAAAGKRGEGYLGRGCSDSAAGRNQGLHGRLPLGVPAPHRGWCRWRCCLAMSLVTRFFSAQGVSFFQFIFLFSLFFFGRGSGLVFSKKGQHQGRYVTQKVDSWGAYDEFVTSSNPPALPVRDACFTHEYTLLSKAVFPGNLYSRVLFLL